MSDDGLDAELLALAGDDSSDGEEAGSSPRQSRSPSAQPARSNRKAARDGPQRGVAQRAKKGRGAAARRKREMEESEEEGEASTSESPRSNGSAPMDQSDSDTSPADFEDDAPLYPIEGKFKSDADRAEIEAMTEIQREEILAERAEEEKKRVQDAQLRQLLQKRKREEESKAPEKRRKVESRATAKSANAALDKYRQQRQEKSEAKARGIVHKTDRRSRSRSSRDAASSDRDAEAEGESEVEWDEAPKPTHEPPADLKDFERIRVGRSNFAKVCFYPTFESSIRGCYARVSIGQDKATGQPQYRMAQIKGFAEGKPYTMEGPTGKPFATAQYAIVAHGKAEKEWPFSACSDSRFTDQEYDRYKRTLADDHLNVPQRKLLLQKLDDIHRLLNHQWSDSDIQKKLDLQRAMQKRYEADQRDRMVNQRKAAEASGDTARVAKLDSQIAQMDAGKSAFVVKAPPATAANQQQERMAALNKANRKTNNEEIRKALLAEKKAQSQRRERAREEMARQAEINNRLVMRGEAELFGDSDISRAGTPALNGNASKKGTPRAGTPTLSALGKTASGFRKKATDEDVIANMDLGIDIEI